MSGTPPSSGPHEGANQPRSERPLSLMQLAPKSVRLLHKNEPLAMRKGRYSILTGKPFEVVVIPQSSEDRVEIKVEMPIQDTSSAQKDYTSGILTFAGRYVPKLPRQAIPHAVYARVWITVTRPDVGSRQFKYTVQIRPTIFFYVMCVLLAFFGLAAQRLTKVLTDTDSIQSALQKIYDDLPTLGSFFAVSTLVVVPVKVLGYFFTRATDTGDD